MWIQNQMTLSVRVCWVRNLRYTIVARRLWHDGQCFRFPIATGIIGSHNYHGDRKLKVHRLYRPVDHTHGVISGTKTIAMQRCANRDIVSNNLTLLHEGSFTCISLHARQQAATRVQYDVGVYYRLTSSYTHGMHGILVEWKWYQWYPRWVKVISMVSVRVVWKLSQSDERVHMQMHT